MNLPPYPKTTIKDDRTEIAVRITEGLLRHSWAVHQKPSWFAEKAVAITDALIAELNKKGGEQS